MLREQDLAAVRSAFVAWAASQRGAPRDVASLFEDADVSFEHVGFLRTDIEGRRVVWKSIPANARARVTVPSLTPQTVDAWNVEPASLRVHSDHIAVCDTCGGERKVRCAACNGIGKQICAQCSGQRKMYGYAANGSRRLLNCTGCRGKGEVDCAHCRRGVTSCNACGGEGRVQQWLELQWWRRSMTNAHPQSIARQCGWADDPPDSAIARDAEPVLDADRPHAITLSDVDAAAMRWLGTLAAPLQPGERVTQQRLRIARVPIWTARYRLAGDEDRVAFHGRRLVPQSQPAAAFARRAANLRSLLLLLLALAFVITILSLVRGPFYWSLATLASLAAFAGALGATYGAAVDWTSVRRVTRGWLITAGAFFAIAIALVFAARPRLGHAERLIAAGALEDAQSELRALGDTVPPRTWADLYAAQVAAADDIETARTALARIPRASPQHALAAAALDALILRVVERDVRMNRLASAAGTLAMLSENARGQPATISAARSVFVPLVERHTNANDWNTAAKYIAEARGLGVDDATLERLAAPIRTAAETLIAAAQRESTATRRLDRRLEAEAVLVSWERASDHWGTPALIALRSAAARDLAAAEKAARRRGR